VAIINRSKNRLRVFLASGHEENPAAFLAALRKPCITQDLHMARDARLALTQHLRKFSHGQFHRPQKRDDSQPGGICKRPECIEWFEHGFGYKEFFISVKGAEMHRLLTLFLCVVLCFENPVAKWDMNR
jgi:hypothetical protein